MKRKVLFFLGAILIASTTLFAQNASDYIEAAQQGNADAQNNLGVCYYNGQGVTKDYKEAVKWYTLAVNQCIAQAQCNLGLCYANGQGVEEDRVQAVEWFKKAVGQNYALAQYNLGVCYYNAQ